MNAQTGVQTTDPKSTFDVNGKPTDINAIDGIQAPRLTRAELTAKGDALYGADQKGVLIYITDASGGDALGQRVSITTVGYYYFDGTQWVKMGTVSSSSGSVPAGTIVAYAGTTAPEGWFLCDGSEVSRTAYADLFAAVQIAYGGGDGINTFNLPNANGVFLRGAGTQNIGGVTYTAATQGTPQGYATGYPTTNGFTANAAGAGQHSHHYYTPSFSQANVGGGGMAVSIWNGGYWPAVSEGVYGGDTPPHTHSISGGDSETRPGNIVVTYIIKY
ncbi:phage tail protein [Flavobacterium sp. NRK F10]|uniref:phage tail protein n=1 Tax=Flavobacterium sp. NRK F10 TaxID=2954931 RepID=UPI002090598D|nr:phage tail protein [Flavobacterium sp. NRK F10]MCO6175402.1 phage tail protein [Flavobacterium sp. NRK F10]